MTTNSLRRELAFKYIRGEGIEIGALHQPLEVPPNVRVHYVDRLDYETILNHYPEIADCSIKNPDIIDDAQTLSKIQDDVYDFCIANHVAEHMRDPVGAIINWLRVLKSGGILYLSIPDINNPLDSGRALTSIDHLSRDAFTENSQEDYSHFLECARYWNKLQDPAEIEKLASENFKKQYSIHYHTFDKFSLEKFFSLIGAHYPGTFRIRDIFENEINGVHEYIYIIEKDRIRESISTHLKSLQADNTKNINLDVIVPVYNAYEDFVKCLDSLLHHNDGYRIILINDHSTDERIGMLFSDLKSVKNEKLVLLENEQNCGFVKTVNTGIKYSKNDVILLNSDTIVTAHWASKIRLCAYQHAQIATVTPLTNNGTICSVPVFLKENDILPGFTIDEFARMIEQISLGQVIEIPTAVGFCMFIRRSVLDRIGLFDEVTFDKGYSEENDFSRRAISRGYSNVICDNTFVYHRGSSSFSTAKKELYEKNLKIISERYPDYLPAVSQFCSLNPLKEIHMNINARLKTWDCAKKDKRVLIILHTFGGGTEKYALELIEALKNNSIFYILQVSGNHLFLEEINNNQKVKYVFTLPNCIDTSLFYDPGYKALVKQIISTFKINLIQVQHLVGQTLDIFEIAHEENIPILMTINDYHILCPLIFLVDEKGNYCVDLNNFQNCDFCISQRLKKPAGFIKQWRNNFERSLKHVTKFISHNSAVFDIIRKVYDIPDEKIIVIEPGHIPELIEKARNRPVRQLHKPLCIAYIGVLDSSHKGMNLFYSLSRSATLAGKVTWKIAGISEIHKETGYYNDYNVHVYGKFRDYSDLSHALEDVDIVINPSLCETFGYTISEAWAMGLPVLASGVGVPKNRIETTAGGWLIDVTDIPSIENTIMRIVDNPGEYYQKLTTVSRIKLNELPQFSREYAALYNTIPVRDIHYSGSQLSAREIYNAILWENQDEILQKKDTIPLSGFTDPFTTSMPLNRRFIKCIQENGIRYTIGRIIVYLKNL